MNHQFAFQTTQAKFSFLGKVLLNMGSFCLLVWAVVPFVPFYCRQTFQVCSNTPWDLVILMVSLGFWSIGLIAILYQQPFFTVTFFSLGSSVLSVGFLSGLENDLAGRGFYILLAWFCPVFLYFHLRWSLLKPRRMEQTFLLVFYLFAGLVSIPFLAWTIANLNQMGWLSFLRSWVRITFLISVLVTVGVLINQWRKPSNGMDRYRIRLILTSIILALSPLLLLSLLPDLIGLTIIPYDVNFTWLLIVPIGYGYGILQQKLIRGNAPVIRLSSYYLIGVLFASVYTITLQVMIRLIPSWSQSWAWLSTGLGIVLLFLLVRANQVARNLIRWLLFGSDHGRLELLTQMTQSLGTVLSRDEYQAILVDQLTKIIPGCRGSALFLETDENNYILQGMAGFDWPGRESIEFKKNGLLSKLLLNSETLIENETVHKQLDAVLLLPEEMVVLSLPGVSLWVPLLSGSDLYGLWLIGLETGYDILTESDQRVFSILTKQAGMAAHNLMLVEAIQASRNELAHAHQELLRGRDEERRKIARELHDNPLQELLGISIQIASLAKTTKIIGRKDDFPQNTMVDTLEHLRHDILSASDKLRLLIGELRPDGLEELGLNVALEGFVRQMEQKMRPDGPSIEVNYDHEIDVLSDHVKITLFRIAQEAIRNASKYAQARHILLTLNRDDNRVFMKIADDGCGFTPPQRLSELASANHFGLLGITERVNSLNGKFDIHSQPGKGTEITIRLPMVVLNNIEKESI